ncbi:hypothetical protein OF001_U210023 [Pseudomonas sp. OF001]|nr:hypothetical protein OF001_U210023 [Pseudomonas sp. OF001]
MRSTPLLKRNCSSSTVNRRLLATMARARTSGFWRISWTPWRGRHVIITRPFFDSRQNAAPPGGCSGCRPARAARPHAPAALEPDRHRPARHGRHPARPALRQPFLAAPPAAALRRQARHRPRGRAGRAAAAVPAACRPAELVLPGLLEPRAGAAGARAEGGDRPPDRPAPGRRPLPRRPARRRQARGADHQRPPRFAVAEAGAGRAGAVLRPPDQLPRLWLPQGGPAVLVRPAAGLRLRPGAQPVHRRQPADPAQRPPVRHRPPARRAPAGQPRHAQGHRGVRRRRQLSGALRRPADGLSKNPLTEAYPAKFRTKGGNVQNFAKRCRLSEQALPKPSGLSRIGPVIPTE